ncbi:MAG: DUF2934 domain-containing protein [Steroidobacteraceae bacterium]|jgi:hypothetical protein|nr:DUF2934 domain-containing protein [Steroidobacteraceae bacterium]
MEQKTTRRTHSRKRSAPGRAAGTPAEAQGAAGGDSSAAGIQAPGPSALAGEEIPGAEPLLGAERITIVGETPLDESASPSAAEQRYQMICERAYVYATERGFEPGGELDDWLRAEREIDAQMGTHRGGSEAGT